MYEIKTIGGRVLFTAPDATTARQALLAAVSQRAYLGGADLGGAYLGGADLGRAYLGGAYLGGAYLGGAYLGGAYLSGTKEKPEHVVSALKARAQRSDGYEFLWFATEEGEVIRAGCRTFSLKDFKAHVADQYPGTPKAKETLRILAFLKAQAGQVAWY